MNERQMRDWMKESLGRLKTLRDEIRVDIHLAGMEARDKWKRLWSPWCATRRSSPRT